MSSYRTKIRFPIISFLTTFITHKTCFTTISIDSNQKTQKKKFDPIFQKFLQVFVPPIGQKFQFLKEFIPTTFLIKKHVSHIFTLIKAKKNTKKFFDPIFQKFLICSDGLACGLKLGWEFVCVCVGWACGLVMCVGGLDVCVRGLGVWLGVGGLGVLVGVWSGVGGLGVLFGVWLMHKT